MLAKGQHEQIVLGQHLGEANVVRNEGGDDTDSTTCLPDAWSVLEVSCSCARHIR